MAAMMLGNLRWYNLNYSVSECILTLIIMHLGRQNCVSFQRTKKKKKYREAMPQFIIKLNVLDIFNVLICLFVCLLVYLSFCFLL